MIYFISDSRGFVKIGLAIDPAARLERLQAATPDNLWIIRTTHGGRVAERWYHERFAAQHIRREWFDYHPDMLTASAPAHIVNTPSRSELAWRKAFTNRATDAAINWAEFMPGVAK